MKEECEMQQGFSIFEWLISNLGSIIVLVIVAIVIGFAVYSIIKDKKKGKCSCGASCDGCCDGGSACSCCNHENTVGKE